VALALAFALASKIAGLGLSLDLENAGLEPIPVSFALFDANKANTM